MPGMVQPQRELTWSEDGERLVSVRVCSLFSGNWHVMQCGDNPRAITRAQWDAWQAGHSIAIAMPQLTAAEREFLMSGATPEEWEAAFGGDED